ncbi:MAG TPA: hypothetical protein VGB62_02155 [Allosphingosinicella sp.]|jgi:hypothetical protein
MRIALIVAFSGLVASAAQAQAPTYQPRAQSGRVSAYTVIGDPRDGPSFDRREATVRKATVRKDGRKCRLRNGGKVCLTPERWSEIDRRRAGRRQAGTR